MYYNKPYTSYGALKHRMVWAFKRLLKGLFEDNKLSANDFV
jgi:hypothetical protein